MFLELITEAMMDEKRREIERRLQRQAVLDYLRDTRSAHPSALRLSAHWLGLRLEQLGTALQMPCADCDQRVECLRVPARPVPHA